MTSSEYYDAGIEVWHHANAIVFSAVVFLFFREGNEPVCIERLEETNFGEHRSSIMTDYEVDVIIQY